jgi:hypothetical protein
VAVVQYTFAHKHPVAVIQYTFTHKHPVAVVQYTFTHKHPVAVVQYTFTHKQYIEQQLTTLVGRLSGIRAHSGQNKYNDELHKNYRLIGKIAGRTLSLRVIPCHLPYK